MDKSGKGCISWRNVHIAATENDGRGIGWLRVIVSRSYTSSELKRLFPGNGLEGMLEGKDHGMLGTAFSFVAGFVDLATGLVKQEPMKRLHTMYFDLVSSLTGYKCGGKTGMSNVELISGAGERIHVERAEVLRALRLEDDWNHDFEKSSRPNGCGWWRRYHCIWTVGSISK